MSDLPEAVKEEVDKEQKQPPPKKLRIADVANGNEDKNKVLLKLATNVLLHDSSDDYSDSDDDDLESLLSYYMTKKLQKRKRNSLLKRLKSRKLGADDYDQKDYLEDVVPSYTEEQFLNYFRVERSLYEQLCKSYAESDWYTKLDPNKRTPANQHIAVFLMYAGSSDADTKRLSEIFDVEIDTINLILRRVTYYISSLSQQYIKWPGEEELKSIERFDGFPKAIGCIGCTYITIQIPEYAGDEYIDRHGNFSLCVQGVCDANRKFIDGYYGKRGLLGAYWVYTKSAICQNLKEKCGDYYLLGNSAYPCNANLITPYSRNRKLSEKEDAFNTRLLDEHLNIRTAFCMLKQRFRQLQLCRLKSHELQVHFIRACCVIHNMAIGDYFDFILPYDSEEHDPSCEGYLSDSNLEEANKFRDPIAEEMEK